MTYKAYDVVVVPFPFTDRSANKKRPALVLSGEEHFNSIIKHSVLCMITTKQNPTWPLDTEITELTETGLSHPSIIRLKLFTLDHRLIIKKIGALAKKDRRVLQKNLAQLFAS